MWERYTLNNIILRKIVFLIPTDWCTLPASMPSRTSFRNSLIESTRLISKLVLPITKVLNVANSLAQTQTIIKVKQHVIFFVVYEMHWAERLASDDPTAISSLFKVEPLSHAHTLTRAIVFLRIFTNLYLSNVLSVLRA